MAVMKRLLFLLVVLGLAGGGWYYWDREWSRPPPPQFQTAKVSRASIISTVSATGTIEPLVKVLVGSQVSGTVMKWYADFNQTIEKGSKLAELDQDRYQRNLDQREAAVAVAKAQAEQAKVKYEEAVREVARLEPLHKDNMASDKEYLDAKGLMREMLAAWHAAEAQVLAAEAERKAAAVDLDKTVIRSPISGVVISRDIDEGQTVAASLQAPTLFTIAADLRKMRVNANVNENDIGRIREGMTAEFSVDAYPGRKFFGRVGQVRYNPTIVENVVTYTTLIDVQNDDLALRPGMTATIAFEVARADDVLSVPTAALRFRPGGPGGGPAGGFGGRRESSSQPAKPTIYTLAGGQPVPVPIEVGLSDGSRTEIVSSELKEGATIITGQSIDSTRPRDPARAMQMMR